MFRVHLDGSIETDNPHEAIKLARLLKADQLTSKQPSLTLPLLDVTPIDFSNVDACVGQVWEKKSTKRQIRITKIKNERVHIEIVKIGEGLKHSGGTRPLKLKYLYRDYILVEG